MDVATALREMFPQVDRRIIRATELEHGDDLQAAIEFIRTEVIGEPLIADEIADESTLSDAPDSPKSFEVSLERSQLEFESVDAFPAEFEPEPEPEPESEPELEDDHHQADDEADQVEEDQKLEPEGEPLWTSTSSSVYMVDMDEIALRLEQTELKRQKLEDTFKEVAELKQKAAESVAASEQAKIRASNEANLILAKAAEIREKHIRVKQANDMRSGDVYGEKAVLATEAKVLVSKIQELDAERQKGSDSLEDSKTSLEHRIEAAKLEVLHAEEASLAKEETARQILLAEENALAEALKESRDLDVEIEANKKLRDFLVEKGTIVDSLQGEIAILNEDIELLKKKIDELTVSEVFESFQVVPNTNWKPPQDNFSNLNNNSKALARASSSGASSVASEEDDHSDSSWQLDF